MALVGNVANITNPFGARLPVFGGSSTPAYTGADLVLDFANSYYRRGATVGTSPTDIAAVVTGTATINASGLLCDAVGESVTFAYSLASVPFIVVVDYAAQSAGTIAGVFEFNNGGSPNSLSLYKNGANTVLQNGTQTSAAYAASGKVACGYNATERVVSFGGATVLKVTQSPPNLSVGTKTIGAFTGATDTALVPIRSVAIYLGTFSDAQIQALAT